MIQIITYDVSKYSEYSDKIYKISNLGEIQALDDFEICVIDLSNEYIWRYNEPQPTNVNCYKDLLTLKEAIINSSICKIVIVMPQNKKFYYNQDYEYVGGTKRYKYTYSIQLKDNKANLIKILSSNLFKIENLGLAFEKTKTIVESKEIDADFNFTNYEETFKAITFSKNSNKVTTIQMDKVYLTTLNILTNNELLNLFIKNYCQKNNIKEEVPEWIQNIKFYN